MMLKRLLTFSCVLIAILGFSQDRLNYKWQVGIGAGLVRYNATDASFIGDQTVSQLPRLNATRKLNNSLSLDVAVSFGNYDSSVFTNNDMPYVSIDFSGRYRYYHVYERLDPYVFIGTSYVDQTIDKGASVTANIGTGVTYWLGRVLALNGQVYYKHAFEQDKIRSHPQVTLGIIFGLGDGRRSRNGSARCYHNPSRKERRSGNLGRCYYDR